MYTDREGIQWAINIAAALRYLHTEASALIVHCGIKLASVLLFPGGPPPPSPRPLLWAATARLAKDCS